jgi:NAD kinase
MEPRAVIVHRATELTALLHDHGTRGKADFFLKTRGRDMTLVQHRHALQQRAMGYVLKAVPRQWRRAMVERSDLDRFLFEPGDIVVAVGQDGLVANTSKYLDGQAVVGINPDPATNAGVLVPHDPRFAREIVRLAAEPTAPIQERTMEARRLRALRHHEVFRGRPPEDPSTWPTSPRSPTR